MDVEALSVAAVETAIAVCSRLKTYLAKNDKTPFTDGHIDIYRDERQTKENWSGRVSVQVKGRRDKRTRKEVVSWPISRVDAAAYLRDSGVLYFYVSVHPVTGKTTVYYANLNPFLLADQLERTDETASTISVGLRPLPKSPEAIERILGVALVTRDQHPGAGIDEALFERANEITLHSVEAPDFEKPTKINLDAGDVAVVLTTSGGMKVPISGYLEITPPHYQPHLAEGSIASGGVVYAEVYRQFLDPDTVRLTLGPCISIDLSRDADQLMINAHLELHGTLNQRVAALKFMRSLSNTGLASIKGVESRLGTTSNPRLGRELEDVLTPLEELAALFDRLGVNSDLVDIDGLDRKQLASLGALHRAIVLGEELSLEPQGPGLLRQDLGEYSLMLLIQPGNNPGYWRVVDALAPGLQFRMWAHGDDGPASAFPVTIYDCIEPSEVAGVLNLHLDSLVESYATLADWPETTFGRANLFLLELIAAADARVDRKAELLDAASRLNTWLIDSEGPEDIHLVNQWQIAHRQQTLQVEDLDEIRALRQRVRRRRSDRVQRLLEVSLSLLLQDRSEVVFLTERLPGDELTDLKRWPIWSLHRGEVQDGANS